MRGRLMVVSVVVIALGSACGSNSNDAGQSPSSPAATTPPVATSPPAPTTPANCDDQTGQAVFSLVMQNTAFSPNCAIAKSSQSIKIENKDGILHNFTITGTAVDVDVQPGQTFTGASAGLAPGTYPFFCKYHKSLGMTGTVIVQ